ncbi:MAG: aspartate carbamoyltransferase catalytic subunit [Actinomycetota bacterium]|nr:aspartate carbamoyltransferase catalytic subunit [Actinomycetota bacterium]MEC7530570.1 aspartate carbamoyltransferase catalytic subunit [Actinomycetota bacterium]MEC7607004.1 aspartate carbamoyltransferase catalytic subunit [Actinomycetota bacterium]MEC8391956.1 aspartate carbamoyltransferase catalytic subunit [Actinomycetota bacterium]MEC9210514.1 aspartate carbamoyltransferase catalytic subunit [Actinomycetota bacterium]|tara:strand:+ start:2354 stop:3301 length:948 start_codon:yes stop_codon:yes gene_type:complete
MIERHIRSIDDLGRSGIEEILTLSDHFHEVSTRRIPKVPALRGKTIALLFYEDSTRTRLSFETASKRLSADSLNFSIGSSSVKKGESLRDTVETISAMGVDAIVVRHGSAGVPWLLPRWTDAAVINAGDGSHEHPTQALLDCYTIRNKLGELDGKRITIVGDIRHSRVARSNVKAFLSLGASVTLVAPKTLMPFNTDDWGVETTDQFDSVIGDSDVLYMLRMQLERQQKSFVPSLREYAKEYGLSNSRAQSMKPESLIMHPGPMNRGVEVSSNIKEHPNSVVNDQVANGVIIRMSALYYLLGTGNVTKLEGFSDE